MLTTAELSFFARNGFLHVKNFVDPDTCETLVDHTWTRFPPEWSRHDPATWSGDLADSCHIADLKARRGLMQFQKGDLLGHPVVDGFFSSDGPGGQLAKELIGSPLSKFHVRGLYAIVPLPSSITYKVGGRPHIEAHPAQLISLHYLEDVVPGGGGLHVWPGSHREIYPNMGSKLEHVTTPEYEEIFDRWVRLQPLELHGERGDVVIIHHRLLHAPSLNRSPNIRYGFLCDYQRSDYTALIAQRPSHDVWEDWPAIAALPVHLRDAPSDYTLSPLADDQLVPASWSAKDRLSGASSNTGDPSSIRKSDASILARGRQVGDVWIALSDDPKTANDIKLFPRGSDLDAQGVRVSVNGERISSLCRFDIISKLPNEPGEYEIEVQGVTRETWIRVLRIQLPFQNTEFLLSGTLTPGKNSLRFSLS